MALETFGFINSLDSANPTASDGLVQGDDHIRGIKATLKAQFPGLTAAVTATAAQINQLAAGVMGFVDGSLVTPSIYFFTETGLGLYRASSGVIGFTGRLLGNGAVPTGAICDFMTGAIPTGWYRLNGQAVSRTGVTAALFAQLGTGYGAGDGATTFNLPNFEQQGGLFRRASASVGLVQGDTVRSFTAPVAGSAADHTHASSISDTRNFSFPLRSYTISGGGGAAQPVSDVKSPTPNDLAASITAGGSLSVSVGGVNSGAIAVSGTMTYTGGPETRPVNMGVVACIKA